MKKILIPVFSACMAIGMVNAQTDCVQFFPESEGSVLTTKSYDANDQLLNTMVYRVNNVQTGPIMNSMQVGFTLMDSNDNVVSNANIDASCNDGNFNMKMVNRGYSPEVVKAMTTNTELMGYFLNYPNVFNDDPFDANPFSMDGGEFTIEETGDKKDRVHVRVYNRQLEGTERIITPARNDSFNSYKITFNFDVTRNKETVTLKGIEWYSPRYGIVRSETYDNNNNLINKTELSSMREM